MRRFVFEEQELDCDQVRVFVRLKFGWLSWVVKIFRIEFISQKMTLRVTCEKGNFKELSVIIEIHPHSVDACEMIEKVEFLVLMPFMFRAYQERLSEQKMKAFFAYRQETIKKDLDVFDQYLTQDRKKILVSGANGLIGRDLVAFLRGMGHQVYVLTRKKEAGDTVFYDDKTGEIDQAKLEGFDTVIHLRGQSVFCRWSKRKKNEIIRSRVESTKKLAHHLALLSHPPKTFLCASAVGYYGGRGEEVLQEKSSCGSGFFLSELTQEWEQATQILVRKNIRVVHLRFGIVLTMRGGALPKIVTPIKYGLAGSFGEGQHWQSWITLDDAVGAISHCIFHEQIAGPVNIVSPNPIRNRDLTSEIASYYGKQPGPKVPTFMVRLFAGQMGEELLLSSTRVIPAVLLQTGFRFRYPTIQDALHRLLRPV